MAFFYLICLFGLGVFLIYLRSLSPKSDISLFTECNPETCFAFKTLHYKKIDGKIIGKVPQACYFYKTCPAVKGNFK